MDTIKKRSIFVRMTKCGVRSRTDNVVLLCLHDTSLHGIEVGYTASKKVGNAVKRNLTKRRMRSIVRNLSNMFQNSYRYVLIAKSSTATCDFSILINDVKRCISNVHYKYQKYSVSRQNKF